ncbi:MAG: BMP family ABC transporter substrate-binding protein [Clostridia bacterium]
MSMKKLLTFALALVMALSLAACGGESNPADPTELTGSASVEDSFKIGFIFLHDENSTYDKNFLDAAEIATAELGLSPEQVIFKTNIPEGNECYEAAADLVDQGCDIIFADSFGHEPYMLKAAKEFPEVEFCHATGTTAHTEGVKNFHNAFASIYEGRYLAGIAAGMKLNEMIESGKITEDQAKMGYVGAFTYAEVVSGYTSFYLGAKSVCPSVTMEVQFTGSWYDEALEKEAATKLLSNNCVLISQHADSMGAPTACENAGVPNVSYNGSTLSACPNTFIVSSRIDWAPYFKYIIETVMNGEEIVADWCEGFEAGAVKLTDVNENVAAAGTIEAMEEAKAKLIAGEINVFDTEAFTVGGEKLESYLADVDTDANYEGDTEVISDGYFHESEFRSAPYFDIQIDGITLLNSAF